MSEAVVVGAGPNGLMAAVVLARAGIDVELFEANESIGGAARTTEATLPGFMHDWGSAVHPMAFASPAFRAFGLTERVEFITPEASYAQAMLGGSPIAWRDIERTAAELGRDGRMWKRLWAPLAERPKHVGETIGSPMLPWPRHPLTAARIALSTAAIGLPGGPYGLSTEHARGLISGVVAHTVRPPSLASAAAGSVLAALAHADGWPVPVGGSQSISDALAADFRAHGGRIHVSTEITSAAELPQTRCVIYDVSAPALLRLADEKLTPRYRRSLKRMRAGNAASKVDFALTGPVPWKDATVAATATVHVGGTWRDVARAEAAVAAGKHADDPYVLLSQPSGFDTSRAPEGMHTIWTYAHVPAGSDRDVTEAVTAQIERHAPGVRDLIVASKSTTAADIAAGDATLVGGDIAAGAVTVRQLLARPVVRTPWRGGDGVYLCSGATVPGPGVHGMGGFNAARTALADVFGLGVPNLSPKSPGRKE